MELLTHSLPKGTERLVLAPLGDIQWSGNSGPTAQDTLRRHIDRCLELDAYFLGLGDYIDMLSPSNRRRLQSAELYDTAQLVIAEKAVQLVEEVYELFLKPTTGRWIFLCEGHHFFEFDGQTTDEILAEKLKTKFVGTSAFARIPSADLVLYAHHGIGAGMLPGVGLNRLYHTAAGLQGADIYLLGHNCLPTRSRILTKRGFKYYNEVFIGEDVLAYNIESRRCEWTDLLDVTTFPLAPLYSAHSKSFAADATPQHQWVMRDWRNNEQLMTLENSTGNHDIVVAALAVSGSNPITARDAAIIGWLVTDGTIAWDGKKPNFQICQKKEPYRSEIRELLGHEATEHEHIRHEGCSYFYLRAALVRRLVSHGFSDRRDLLTLIPTLSQEARGAMLSAFLKAEGDGEYAFSQQLGPVWDAFLMLTAMQGRRCGPGVLASDPTKEHCLNGKPVVYNAPVYRKKLLKRSGSVATVGYLKITEADPGPVWCPTTKFGTWIAELDRHVFITGNTRLATARLSRPYPIWDKRPRLEHRDIWLVNCGSFSKSNIAGHRVGAITRGDYAEQKMLTPSPLSAPIITVDLRAEYDRVRVSI